MYATMANTQQRYQEQCILTASPVELIVLLYDGCIKQLKMAAISIKGNNTERANTALQKAQQIIMELINSLDLHFSLASELMKIYDFLLNEIIQINVNKDADRILGCLNILEDLRDAWRQIAKKTSGSAIMAED